MSRPRPWPLLVMGALAACGPPVAETVAGAAQGAPWQLTQFGDAAPPAALSLRFDEGGGVSGMGPCNRFSAAQTAPLPWFTLGPIRQTKRACPALAAEATLLTALQEMRFAERQDDTLLLTGDGPDMVFTQR